MRLFYHTSWIQWDSDMINSSRHEIALSRVGLSVGKEKNRVPPTTPDRRMGESG